MDDLPPNAFIQATLSSPAAQPSSSAKNDAGSSSQAKPTPAVVKAAPKPKKPREERVKGKTTLAPHKVQIVVQERNQFNITSKEAAFVLTAAVEEFLRLLILASQKQSFRARHQLIALRDIANIVHEQERLNFLEETIPRTVDVTVAMTLRNMIQNGARDTNADNNSRDSRRDATPPPLATVSNNMSNGTPSHFNGRGHTPNHDDHWGTDSEHSIIMEDEV